VALAAIAGLAVGFLFDKGADKLFARGTTALEKRKLRKNFLEFAENYCSNNFAQIPMDSAFDLDGLRDYLYQHLDGNITLCFCAVNEGQRQHYRDALFANAYNHAHAKTREQRNAVNVYVQTVLELIRTQLTDKAHGVDCFLFGEAVADLKGIMQKAIATAMEDLKNFVQYEGSFAQAIDSVIHQTDTKIDYHYLRRDIAFQGRRDDLAYLDGFLDAPEPFLFTVITGQGGSGKSKLMHHYLLRETGNQHWKIVFPSRGQIESFAANYTDWRYPKNLLLVIDYAGELPEVVGRWIANLQGTSLRPRNLRIVMLERQGGAGDKSGLRDEPYWYTQIKEHAGHNFDDLLYQGQFRRLAPLDGNDLFALMDNIAATEKKEVSSQTKTDILAHAREMGGAFATERFDTPLFVILLTVAVLDETNDILLGKITPAMLMTHVIERHQKNWLALCSGDKTAFAHLQSLIAYATATGGWNLSALPAPLAEASGHWLDKYSRRQRDSMLAAVSGTAADQPLVLAPDIVGEYFVLNHLFERSQGTDFADLVDLLWKTPLPFAFFLERCIGNYLCLPEFAELVEGSYSLFAGNEAIELKAMLLVNLSADLPLERCHGVVDLLANMASERHHAHNHAVVLEYAKGLFNLSNVQDVSGSEETVETLLGNLARDSRYCDNHKIVLSYAMALGNLSLNQDARRGKKTVERLESLARDLRYCDNHEIVLGYAIGLFNFSNKQDVSGCTETVNVLLGGVARDPRYCDNHAIVSVYADGLSNLSACGCATTVATLKALADDPRYCDNYKITLAYARGLVNHSINQEDADARLSVNELQLLEVRCHGDQGIAVAYANGLAVLAIKQQGAEREATLKCLIGLTEDPLYCNSQEILDVYKKACAFWPDAADDS